MFFLVFHEVLILLNQREFNENTSLATRKINVSFANK